MRRGRLAPDEMYPAGAAGIEARFIDVHGVRARVLESGARAGDAVVLLHGWGACLYSWNALIPSLAARGYRVIAPELPGHGLSDKPLAESHYTNDALARFVVGAMSALGVERAHVVGHSMGAAVAIQLGRSAPTVVRSLALLSPVGIGTAPWIWPIRWLSPRVVDRVMPTLLPRSLFRAVLRFAYGTRGRPTDNDVAQYWAATQFDDYARACRACAHAFDWRQVAPEILRALDCPILVVCGGRDRIVLGAEAPARRIPGARVVVLQRGGHIIVQDSSDDVTRELLAFLSAHGDRERTDLDSGAWSR